MEEIDNGEELICCDRTRVSVFLLVHDKERKDSP